MALVVEDGNVIAGAESYASVAEADTYWTNRGVSAWAGSTPAKEIALRKATDYLEQVYRLRWSGARLSSSQVLSWPRRYITVDGFTVPTNMIPMEVKRATIELAKRAVSAELLPDAVSTSGDVIREKLGDMEIQYSEGTSGGSDPIYDAATTWLSVFLSGSGTSIRSTEILRA